MRKTSRVKELGRIERRSAPNVPQGLEQLAHDRDNYDASHPTLSREKHHSLKKTFVFKASLRHFFAERADISGNAMKVLIRRRKPPKPVDTHGLVTIMSTTVGASIYIDQKYIGRVPYTKPLRMLPGSYTIKVVKRGYTDYLDVFKVAAGKTTDLEIDLIAFQGILKLTCVPADAEIYLGTKYIGTSPIDLDVGLGKHILRVKKPGFYDHVQPISISAGKTFALSITLKAIPGWKPPILVVKKTGKTPFYKTWWFWTIIGVAVAGGTTAGVVLGTRGSSKVAPSPNLTINVP